MQTKHFFNDPVHLVNTALHSLSITNPSLALDAANKTIYRRLDEDGSGSPKVSIISGGGSGHEPAFAGFVGKGLLTASVAGTIFASPSAEQVRRAILTRVPTENGVLVITMNYTGDVLNFGMAAEKAKAAGIPTEFWAIADDVGVGREKAGKVGRRGIAGGILVLKMCGALADLGATLSEVYSLAKITSSNLVSVGASLEHVHVPGRAVPESSSDEDTLQEEIEVGMGIHNEPGSHRVSGSLPKLIKTILSQLLDPNDKDRAFVSIEQSHQTVLFINNLGGVSMLELAGITAEVSLQLNTDYNLHPVRTITGTFLTSLNGMGFSVSILKLVDTGLGPGKSMLELLDHPAEAIGWSAPIQSSTWTTYNNKPITSLTTPDPAPAPAPATPSATPSNLTLPIPLTTKTLTAGLQRLIAAEPYITHYDTIVGDGDCGTCLARGASAILTDLHNAPESPTDAVAFVHRIASVVETHMDGTSGALYAIFLNALAAALREHDTSSSSSSSSSEKREVDAKTWAVALQSSLTALAKYTAAQPGDRTLMDALVPFVRSLAEHGDLAQAAEEAARGAEETKGMKASLGRAVYVGGEERWMGKVPDPGAWGLRVLFRGMAGGLVEE